MNLGIDSVYFFMWPGWREATRANRWHYGRRWARRLPVVMLQPEREPDRAWLDEPEPRIQNVEILSIRQVNANARPCFEEGLAQARQIVSYMRRRGHHRPLLWLYNPYLTFAYCLVPASLRVYHATENYFDFVMPNTDLADLKRAAIDVSEKVICCSSGVLEGCRNATGHPDLHLVPNGCDYEFYTDSSRDMESLPPRLRELLNANRRYAVFAGNINLRMDFPLMHRLAEERPELHFVYAGPVDWDYLELADRDSWSSLLNRHNVTYLGPLDPEDLPPLYRGGDVGIIPYRELPFLVKNGFPLKALEMAASGLPVVSSLMEPLLEIPDAVSVVRSGDEFADRLRHLSRRTRPAEAAVRADAVCRAYDYDRHFQDMLNNVLPAVHPGPARVGQLDRVYDRLGLDRVLTDQLPYDGAAAGAPISLAQRLLRHIPQSTAARVPAPIKVAIKRSLGLS